MKDYKKLEITTMDQGGAVEAINLEIQKCIENILDPNTQAICKRVITFKISINPDPRRAHADILYQASSKLAANGPYGTQAALGKNNGVPSAFENKMIQDSFEFPDDNLQEALMQLNEKKFTPNDIKLAREAKEKKGKGGQEKNA